MTVEHLQPNCSQIDGAYGAPSPIHEEPIANDRPRGAANDECLGAQECSCPVDTGRKGTAFVPPGRERLRISEVKRFGVMTMGLLCVASIVSAFCPSEPTAQIVIHLLPSSKLNAVKLFFNRARQNQVHTTRWLGRNRTQLDLFDLESAAPSENLLCYARSICPYAHIQNLAACDPATGRCVCSRGYELDHGVCLDEDECVNGRHNCPATSTCQNAVGSYTCVCGLGFYGADKFCHDCSVGCPSGSYESVPCSSYGDRVCAECKRCDGPTFEVKPCSATSDRECMHVARGVLINADAIANDFLNEMKVEASPNVYLEDLRTARNLDTTYYVTDMTQASDFHWDRESGLRVNVGILNVQLIPKYEDVSHDSDNSYMLGNQNTNEDKSKFQNIVKHYCRHPIPDYYSITLEIYRDRTTAAREILCDSQDPKKPPCPQPYKNGDTFLHRTLNDACQQMGTFPEPLKQAENSIVCTDGSALLREVFNQSHTAERPIPFPTRKCRAAKSRCDQCLNQLRCLAKDVFERKCCHVECFTLMDCKQMTSDECSNVSVECAMGDAYRYTIQPVFQNIRTEFQCHIQHNRYEVLYELFSFIQIPNTSFQTPKLHKKIYAKDVAYQSRGEYKAGFLSIEHNTGLDLKDEFILVGREIENGRFNFTVHSIKMEEENRKKKIVIHGISPNVFVASSQFERPFDYSTSSWMRNNDCNKNVTKLKAVQKHYGIDSEEVTIALENNIKNFKYVIKSSKTAPFLRFFVPGNVSILSYYFLENGPFLVMNDSLHTSLTLTGHGRFWEIVISGRMSDCPGYLGITVKNRADLEELFRHEALILCPSDFNLTFRVPNWGQHPDKAFDLRLHDAMRSYTIYLTQLVFEETHVESEPEAINTPNAPNIPMNFFMAFALVILLLLVIFSIAYIYKEMKTSHILKESQKIAICHFSTAVKNSSSQRTNIEAEIPLPKLKPKLVTALYFTFWTVYSFGFTFTMFFVAVSLFTRDDLIRVTEIGAFQAKMLNVSTTTTESIKRYRVNELGRQLRAVTQMQDACNHYVGQLFTGLSFNIEKVIDIHQSTQMYGPHTSLGHLLVKRSRHRLAAYAHNLKRFIDDYEVNVTTSMAFTITTYHKYLQSVFHSDWFSFPQRLFNSSDVERHLPGRTHGRHFAFLGYEADFGSFLEIEELEQVKLWPMQFWERFFNRLPEDPTFAVPTVNRTHLHCATDNNKNIANMTRSIHLDHLHSFHFFSNHVSSRISSSEPRMPMVVPMESHSHDQGSVQQELEEAQFYDDVSNLEAVDDAISGVLHIIFLLLDVLLLVYRFTTMYCNGLTIWKHFSSSGGSVLSNSGTIVSLDRTSTSPNVAAERKPLDYSVPDFASSACASLPAASNRTEYLNVGNPYELMYSCPRPGIEVARVGSSDVVFARLPSVQSNEESVKRIVAQILQSSACFIFVIVGTVLLLSYITIKATLLFLDVRVFASLDCFNMYINAIRTQINQSDWYLSDEARYLNQLAVDYYRSHVQSELANLQGLLDYFNSEQKRLQMNYIAEACSIRKVPQENWSCDVSIRLPHVEYPIIPCNFLPLQPLLYSGFKTMEYETQLNSALAPYLASARNVITRTLYTGLTMTIAVLIVHIITSILTFCFEMRQSYENPPSVQKDSTGTTELLESVSRSEGLNADVESIICPNFVNNKVHHSGASLSGSREHQTQLLDFKYSETIV